jgi:hypothetical protein
VYPSALREPLPYLAIKEEISGAVVKVGGYD